MDSAPALARKPLPAILFLSAFIAGFLIWLIYFKGRIQAPVWVAYLPSANALFNSLSAVCLIFGYINIRKRKRVVHMRFMLERHDLLGALSGQLHHLSLLSRRHEVSRPRLDPAGLFLHIDQPYRSFHGGLAADPDHALVRD